MSDFDWDAAIDKARTSWAKGYIRDANGGECAVGILASVSGMEVKQSQTSTEAAISFVVKVHPEAVEALHQVLLEQDPKAMEMVLSWGPTWGSAEDPLQVMASNLVEWNDQYCPGGEQLATYLEKAKVR